MRRLAFVLAVSRSSATAWQLRSIDASHANTIIRLWHDLYRARGMAHDFGAMLAPSASGLFFAAVNHDEIRAIGACRGQHVRMQEACVNAIAHKPDQEEAARMLIALLSNTSATIDVASLRLSQPRWMLEALFIGEPLSS